MRHSYTAGMAATQTRLLVLGAVALFEPVNGYQIRRELLSWDVEQWAHINPGSIYSALTTLTKQQHLVRHDLVDGGRTVAVYTVSPAGRAELDRLFGEALETVDAYDSIGLQTALSMSVLVPRPVVLGHLEKRLATLGAMREKMAADAAQAAADDSLPPHVVALVDLWSRLAATQHDWLDETVRRVRAGDFAYAGEPMGWQPAADDPGWQMQADRERYRAMLAE